MSRGRLVLLLALALGSGPGLALGSEPVFVAQAAPKAVKKAALQVVTIDGFAFKPPVVTVKQGETIEWRNDDPVPHTATSKAAGLDSGSIAPGATYRFVAKKKGRFDYLCTFHPIMKGEIVVE